MCACFEIDHMQVLLSGPNYGAMFTLQHIVTDCEILNVIFFLNLSGFIFKYLSIATFRKILACRVSVLERLEKVIFSQSKFLNYKQMTCSISPYAVGKRYALFWPR